MVEPFQMPFEMLRSVYITIPQNSNTLEYKNHI